MQQKKNDLVEGAILPSLLKFAVPVLLALVLQALYGSVDLWAVGKFGTTADISAVSTGSQTMQSITAFVSQNVGAGKQERARRAMWKGMGTALILGEITAYVSYFHGDALSMLFVKNGAEGQTAVIRDAADFLRATSIECFILSIAYCLTGYFNGCGKTGFVMLQGLGAIFLVKIPYAYYASQKAVPQLFDIGLSTAYAALFTLAVCLIYYWYMHERKCEKYNKKTS